MTWVKLDVAFPDHPKTRKLSDAAFRLHVTALCYARQYLTDGHIPDEFPPQRLRRAIPQLLEVHLWIEDPEGDGWHLNGFLDWQNSRAEAETLTKQRSDAGRRGAEARWQTDSKRHGTTHAHPDSRSEK